MPKDELSTLREFMLALQQEQAPLASVRSLEDRAAFIRNECQRIKATWSGLLLSRAKDYMIKRYVWFQQQNLLELADQVFRITQKESAKDDPPRQSSVFLLEKLLELNNFLISYFPLYFNQNSKIPEASMVTAKERMCSEAKQLDELLDGTTLDVNLKQCIRYYLLPIVKMNSALKVTYRSCDYLIQLTESFNIIIPFKEAKLFNELVSEALYHLNFNQSAFFQWHQERIKQRISVWLSSAERFNALMEELSQVQIFPLKMTVSFDPDIPPINLLIERWLREEIRKEAVVDPFLSEKYVKMPLTLSVPHLGLMIRLLYDQDFFAVKNASHVLRFFSRHFSSKKQDHISPESLRKSYYTDDQFVAAVVRDLLIKMLKRINELFFPEEKK
ncbi:MAG: hypothetical protein JWM28_2006 [Chitinophagaceae bacterium]|nr:hypothetical protein [Chitinophagaceae bacterium]